MKGTHNNAVLLNFNCIDKLQQVLKFAKDNSAYENSFMSLTGRNAKSTLDDSMSTVDVSSSLSKGRNTSSTKSALDNSTVASSSSYSKGDGSSIIQQPFDEEPAILTPEDYRKGTKNSPILIIDEMSINSNQSLYRKQLAGIYFERMLKQLNFIITKENSQYCPEKLISIYFNDILDRVDDKSANLQCLVKGGKN